ncbi:MAG: polysaccharide deacetylase family protein [Caldilineaceae bacterium]|nr:polysaccharide deacetylase family protein [Caldilineaceae bacterium]MCB0065849.1 polysaccharide deacetylase family protein [Caldilineaceae bacterium]HRW47955.1 polysaccharide deacetylase family protein [Caldilinea sp.]
MDKPLYLTFDDGPQPGSTDVILSILAEYGAHADFFMIGRQVAAHPDLAAAAYAAGHGIGNHTYHHPSLCGIDHATMRAEVSATREVLGALGSGYLRPPYGYSDLHTARIAAELGYALLFWHVDPRDWRRPGAEVIARHVLRNCFPGAIILLHDGGGEERSQTHAALHLLLPALIGQGYALRSYCRTHPHP